VPVLILITHAFSLEQKGDSALLAGTISQLRRTFPDAQIMAQIMGQTTARQEYKGVPVMESVIYIATVPDINRFLRLLRMMYVAGITLAWAGVVRLTGSSRRLGMSPALYQSCQAIYEADLVVPVAGGYLAGAPGIGETINMVFIVLPLWLSHLLGKPVVHFSQSIGPFANRIQRWLVEGPLRRARLVVTRESVSTDFARSLGVKGNQLAQSIDAGFLFEPEPSYAIIQALEGAERRDRSKRLVGITSKKHLAPEPQARYERELAEFADYVCARHAMQVVFIPQVTSPELGHDDRILNRRLFDLMKHKADAFLIEKNLTNHETKAA
jgi:polysaccharide pyruvyl transferase WcaK-like protein